VATPEASETVLLSSAEGGALRDCAAVSTTM
jgi:hypothetical protein